MHNSNDLNKWLILENEKFESLYSNDELRRPKNYADNNEALSAIYASADIARQQALIKGRRAIGIGEAAEAIASTVAATCVPVQDGYSLAIYDYDKCIYTFNTSTVLNDYIVALLGYSSQSLISSMTTTLIGLRSKLAIYNPLPRYKIAVGNGIYNCLTSELENFTPEYTVLTKIKTNLVKNAKRPKYSDGFTLESMIQSLSNGMPERKQLIGQICKAIITGHSLKPGLFVILGKGGDGKSTFFSMISNMIGQDNVAYVNFSEIYSDDKMAETMNKKLVLGLDNDVKIYIKKTALIKTMSSHEMITLSRKYLSAISIPFTATVVQLCNEFPRIAETGSSMKRRIVPFKAENSHYENKTENDNIDNVYVKDERFLEYALWYFLNDKSTPYYSDFNDVDRDVALNALDAEDTIGQFVSDLESLGIASDVNKFLPTSHLYAAYLDWMSSTNEGSSPLSSKGFSMKISERLYISGYQLSDKNVKPRPLSLDNIGSYSIKSWGSLEDGNALKQSIIDNRPSRTFEKVRPGRSELVIRRDSNIIDAVTYFKVDVDIEKELNPQFEDVALETVEHIETQTHKEHSIVDTVAKVPSDIRIDVINNDTNNIINYKNWLNDLVSSSDVSDAIIITRLDNISQLLMQVAYKINDVSIVSQLNTAETSSTIDDTVYNINLVLDMLIERSRHDGQ